MARRDDLHALLVATLGSNHVYFQPPPSIQMMYPCIVYQKSDVRALHANDKPYNRRKRYQVTVIDRNPDSEIPDRVGALPTCSFDRAFTADDLNHDVFDIFF